LRLFADGEEHEAIISGSKVADIEHSLPLDGCLSTIVTTITTFKELALQVKITASNVVTVRSIRS
jgi:hypothetical protein